MNLEKQSTLTPIEDNPEYTIITREGCPPCMMAKELLSERGSHFVEIKEENLTDAEKQKMTEVGHPSFPQIFKGSEISSENLVGGYDDLSGLFGDNTNANVVNIIEYEDGVTDRNLGTALGTGVPIISSAVTVGIGATSGIAMGLVSMAVGILLQKKTDKLREFGEGVELGGILSTGVLTALSIGFESALLTIASTVGITLTLFMLMYFLTGKYSKAKKVIGKKMGEKESESLIDVMKKGGGELLANVKNNIKKAIRV